MSCKSTSSKPTSVVAVAAMRLRGDERHKSIIAYFSANGPPAIAAALRQEFDLGEDVLDSDTVTKYEGLLEKKWISVIRLQKKAQTAPTVDSVPL